MTTLPQSLIHRLTPSVQKTYFSKKKAKKVPPSLESSPKQPQSPLVDNVPLENIQRETTGVSSNPKDVLSKEMDEHMDDRAHTTASAQGVVQDNVNIPKTLSMATLSKKLPKGPRCQETKGEASAFARQKAASKSSSDIPKVVNTPKGIEDSFNYSQDELMETWTNVLKDAKLGEVLCREG